MTPEQVQRVAEVLERTAKELRESFTSPITGQWDTDQCAREAGRDHDECLRLAKAARKMLARYRRACS